MPGKMVEAAKQILELDSYKEAVMLSKEKPLFHMLETVLDGVICNYEDLTKENEKLKVQLEGKKYLDKIPNNKGEADEH